ncbi:hypothetical protein F5X96DRAFT_525984 [Biscogniauxia mediterranea]|nr:hypothetical protein F5X96DRAFT_525984 [Biscogniauxia mediterranea]
MICMAIASLVAELAVYTPLEANWASSEVIMTDAMTLTIPGLSRLGAERVQLA